MIRADKTPGLAAIARSISNGEPAVAARSRKGMQHAIFVAHYDDALVEACDSEEVIWVGYLRRTAHVKPASHEDLIYLMSEEFLARIGPRRQRDSFIEGSANRFHR
jgi:hypothetical protein